MSRNLTHPGDRHRRGAFFVALLLVSMAPACAAPRGEGGLEDRRRVVLIDAGNTRDPAVARQRQALAHWTGAESRDVSVIEIIGDTVLGSADDAASLRRRYDLSDGGFTVLLIGKDGHVALRSRRPLSGSTLAAAIDAMPMRRAGGR